MAAAAPHDERIAPAGRDAGPEARHPRRARRTGMALRPAPTPRPPGADRLGVTSARALPGAHNPIGDQPPRPQWASGPRVRPTLTLSLNAGGPVSDAGSPPRDVRPGWFTNHVFNPIVAGLTRAGVSVWGSRELWVRGRTSGEWRHTPVNLVTVDGQRYLVAPRGETPWVRNLRVATAGGLQVRRRRTAFRAVELTDDEKPVILRAYLKRWKAEVGVFFGGVSADASDDELLRIAPDHPVFRITMLPDGTPSREA